MVYLTILHYLEIKIKYSLNIFFYFHPMRHLGNTVIDSNNVIGLVIETLASILEPKTLSPRLLNLILIHSIVLHHLRVEVKCNLYILLSSSETCPFKDKTVTELHSKTTISKLILEIFFWKTLTTLLLDKKILKLI